MGGLRRFYFGFMPALVQGPLGRFGDTAANAVIIELLDSNPATTKLPIIAQVFIFTLSHNIGLEPVLYNSFNRHLSAHSQQQVGELC